jgi:hypothetical protein
VQTDLTLASPEKTHPSDKGFDYVKGIPTRASPSSLLEDHASRLCR